MTRTDEVPTADIVPTPELLERLLAEKSACWPFAAFASVLFQRVAAVEERRINVGLGTCVHTSESLETARDVGLFVSQHICEADDLVRDADIFMRAPTFMGVFGDPDDDSTADANGIVRVAHRLMDFYDRFLELAEECRTYSVPDQYADLIRDCTVFMNAPLRDFGHFINDVLVRFEEMRRCVASGSEDVQLPPVLLRTTTDDDLVWSILDRLQTIE